MKQKMVLEENTKKKKVLCVRDLPGVGPASVQKLESAGFGDLMSIAVATPGEIVSAADLSEGVARKIIDVSRENLQMDFQSGEEILARRKNIMKIKTGSSNFDELIGEGIETGSITEVYGAFGSGKSQIAHVLAVRSQEMKNENDEPGIAVFIDTESTFRPERIMEIARHMELDENEVLRNIRVARAFNSDHQLLLAEKVEDLIKKQKLNIRIVIVDSLTSHFRAEYVGRGTLSDRQQKLNKHMHTLAKLAAVHNICIFVTNQVMSRPDVFFGDPTAAIGGHIVAHNSTFRMYLRRGKKGTRVAKLVDAPNRPDLECVFKITEKGIENA